MKKWKLINLMDAAPAARAFVLCSVATSCCSSPEMQIDAQASHTRESFLLSSSFRRFLSTVDLLSAHSTIRKTQRRIGKHTKCVNSTISISSPFIELNKCDCHVSRAFSARIETQRCRPNVYGPAIEASAADGRNHRMKIV